MAAQTQLNRGAFQGDPAADTVFVGMGVLNTNIVTVDADQIAQDVLITANTVSNASRDIQIGGLGTSVNTINLNTNTNTANIALNTTAIANNLNMTYAFAQVLALTPIGTVFQAVVIASESAVPGFFNYEYRLSVFVSSDTVDQTFYIQFRISAGPWTEVECKTQGVGVPVVVTLWDIGIPATNNTNFEIEIKKDVASVGIMTVEKANASIVQMKGI